MTDRAERSYSARQPAGKADAESLQGALDHGDGAFKAWLGRRVKVFASFAGASRLEREGPGAAAGPLSLAVPVRDAAALTKRPAAPGAGHAALRRIAGDAAKQCRGARAAWIELRLRGTMLAA